MRAEKEHGVRNFTVSLPFIALHGQELHSFFAAAKMSFCGWGGEKYKDHFENGERSFTVGVIVLDMFPGVMNFDFLEQKKVSRVRAYSYSDPGRH